MEKIYKTISEAEEVTGKMIFDIYQSYGEAVAEMCKARLFKGGKIKNWEKFEKEFTEAVIEHKKISAMSAEKKFGKPSEKWN